MNGQSEDNLSVLNAVRFKVQFSILISSMNCLYEEFLHSTRTLTVEHEYYHFSGLPFSFFLPFF